MRWYMYVLKKYFTLDGRAGVKEFWTFSLIHLLLCIALFFFCVNPVFSATTMENFSIINKILPVFFLVYYIVLTPPAFAIQVRRLHDTNRSGWFLLFNLIPVIGIIVLLFFFTRQGDTEQNAYGPVPEAQP